MIYQKETNEANAAQLAAQCMTAAARTAPKACGVDVTEAIVADGEDKDKLTAAMREIASETGMGFFNRDAGNVDASLCVVLIGSAVHPRGLNCKLCGKPDCKSAAKDGVSCAMAVNDLGIALGSAAATAMDHRIDNRILYSAGMAALKLKLFPEKIKMCFGIGLAVAGKNVFFDRPEA
jgi:uncharacterized ferredoxin-like protein